MLGTIAPYHMINVRVVGRHYGTPTCLSTSRDRVSPWFCIFGLPKFIQ